MTNARRLSAIALIAAVGLAAIPAPAAEVRDHRSDRKTADGGYEAAEPFNPFPRHADQGVDAPKYDLECRVSQNADGTVTIYFTNAGTSTLPAPVSLYAEDDNPTAISNWFKEPLKPGETYSVNSGIQWTAGGDCHVKILHFA